MANVTSVEHLKKMMDRRGVTALDGTVRGVAAGYARVQIKGSPEVVLARVPTHIPPDVLVPGRPCSVGIMANVPYIIAAFADTNDNANGYVPAVRPRLGVPGIAATVTGNGRWALSFTPVNGASRYLVYASNSQNGEGAIDLAPFGQFSGTKNVIYNNVPSGARYFAVRAVDSYGREGPLSSWVTDTVAPPTPANPTVYMTSTNKIMVVVPSSDTSANHPGYQKWDVHWSYDGTGVGWYLGTFTGNANSTSVKEFLNPTLGTAQYTARPYVRLRAADWAGNVSGWTGWVRDVNATFTPALSVYKTANGANLVWTTDYRVLKYEIRSAADANGTGVKTVGDRTGNSISVTSTHGFFSVRAIMLNGLEGPWTAWIKDNTIPLTVDISRVTVTNLNGRIRLTIASDERSRVEPGFAHWQVWYKDTPSGSAYNTGVTFRGSSIELPLDVNTVRYYAFKTVDLAGNISELSGFVKGTSIPSGYGQLEERFRYLAHGWLPLVHCVDADGNIRNWTSVSGTLQTSFYHFPNLEWFASPYAQFTSQTTVRGYFTNASGLDLNVLRDDFDTNDVITIALSLEYGSAATFTATLRLHPDSYGSGNYLIGSGSVALTANGRFGVIKISKAAFTAYGSGSWSNVRVVDLTITSSVSQANARVWIGTIRASKVYSSGDRPAAYTNLDTEPSMADVLGRNEIEARWLCNDSTDCHLFPFDIAAEFKKYPSDPGLKLEGYPANGVFIPSTTCMTANGRMAATFMYNSYVPYMPSDGEFGIAFGLKFEHYNNRPTSGFLLRAGWRSGNFIAELCRLSLSGGNVVYTVIASKTITLPESCGWIALGADWTGVGRIIRCAVAHYKSVSTWTRRWTSDVYTMNARPEDSFSKDDNLSRGGMVALWFKGAPFYVADIVAGSPEHAHSADIAQIAKQAYTLISPVADNIELLGTLKAGALEADVLIGQMQGDRWRGSGAGDMVVDLNRAGAGTLHIRNDSPDQIANLQVEGSILVGGTVDGVDISNHAGDASAHHAPITLSAALDNGLLGLSGQQLTLDSQNAKAFLGGPTSGGAAAPSFRSLVAGDLPAHTHKASDQGGDYPWAYITGFGTDLEDVVLVENAGASTLVARADHVHALSQAITPVWTGLHTFRRQGEQLRLGYDVSNYAGLEVSAGGALTLTPTGNLLRFGITNGAVSPTIGYTVDLGVLTTKYRALHAAELWVETLVAQDTLATIGGRILVGPTTILAADVGTAATSITVKHNNLLNGDRIYLESDGKVEFMSIDSSPSGSGPYVYNVTRNLDGSGANEWFAGDAVFNTGTTGNGFIDLYSVRGVLSGFGPTIVGNVRTGTAFNAYAPRWAVGNLNALYDYGANNVYGFAAGNYSATWVAVDATSGFRVMNSTTQLARWFTDGVILIGQETTGQSNIRISAGNIAIRNATTEIARWDSSGNITLGRTSDEHVNITATALSFRDGATVLTNITGGAITIGQVASGQSNVLISAGTISIRNNTAERIRLTSGGELTIRDGSGNAVITLDASAGAEITRKLTMPGTSSAIAIGSTPPTSATAGTGIWIDRTGFYGLVAGAQQVRISASDGKLYAGGGAVRLDTDGVTISNTAVQMIRWLDGTTPCGYLLGGSRGPVMQGTDRVALVVGSNYVVEVLTDGVSITIPITVTGEGYFVEDRAGLMARIANHHQWVTDHFRSGSIPSGYAWTSSFGQSGTPTSILDYSYRGDYMRVAGNSSTASHSLVKRGPLDLAGCRGKTVLARMAAGSTLASIIIWYLISGVWRYVTLEIERTSGYNINCKFVYDVGGSQVLTTFSNFGCYGDFFTLRLYHHTDDRVYTYIYNESGLTQNMPSTPVLSAITDSYWGLRTYGTGQPAVFDWFQCSV
jgi:hypothetical protein